MLQLVGLSGNDLTEALIVFQERGKGSLFIDYGLLGEFSLLEATVVARRTSCNTGMMLPDHRPETGSWVSVVRELLGGDCKLHKCGVVASDIII